MLVMIFVSRIAMFERSINWISIVPLVNERPKLVDPRMSELLPVTRRRRCFDGNQSALTVQYLVSNSQRTFFVFAKLI
jgi:hypothetical protein